MRRFFAISLFLLGLVTSLSSLAQTPTPLPVTGNLGTILGSPQPFTGVDFLLQNCAGPVSIPGYWGIVATEVQLQANSAGFLSSTIWPNDLVDCNGTTGASQYAVSFIVNGVPSGTPQCYQVTSTQGIWNMNVQQPIACSQTPPNPQDGQFRNLNVTNCLSIQGGACNAFAGGSGYVVVAGGQTITQAIGTLGALGGKVLAPCGAYTDNLDIVKSGVAVYGADMNCVTLTPANPALPAVYFDGTNAGSAGLVNDELGDMTLTCPGTTVCQDAIKVSGPTGQDYPNDWIKISRLTVVSNGGQAASATYGFLNGLDILNRTIWDEFNNLQINGMRNNGVNINVSSSTAGMNDDHFTNLRAGGNWNYGVYVSSTNTVNPIEGLSFINSNVEFNGNNTALANCAGMSLTGTSQAHIENVTFEGDCPANAADSSLAELRLTGTYDQATTVLSNTFNLSSSPIPWAVNIDANQVTATIAGNKFSAPNLIWVHAGPSTAAMVEVGNNYNQGVPVVTTDVNGNSHYRQTSPLAVDWTSCPAIIANTITLTGQQNSCNLIGTTSTSYTLANIVPVSAPGQLQWLRSVLNAGTLTIEYAQGGAGQIYGPGSASGSTGVLQIGDVVQLISDGSAWHVVDSNLLNAGLLGNANNWSLAQTLGGGAILPNNTFIQAQMTGASATGPFLGINAANIFEIGDITGILGSGSSEYIDFNASQYITLTNGLISTSQELSIPSLALNGGAVLNGVQGDGGIIMSGTGSFTGGHCLDIDATTGSIADSGATCAGGGGGLSLAFSTTGTSGASTASLSGGTLTLNIPVYVSANVANTTLSLSSFAIPANTCYGSTGSTTPATFTMTGVTSSPQMNVWAGWQGNPHITTGWGQSGGLQLDMWVSGANTVSYVICNPTSASITGGTPTFIISAK